MDFIAICHERNEVAFIPNMQEVLERHGLDVDDLYYSMEAYGHLENLPSATAEWWLCSFVEDKAYRLTVMTIQEISGNSRKKLKPLEKLTVVDIMELLRPENVAYLKASPRPPL